MSTKVATAVLEIRTDTGSFASGMKSASSDAVSFGSVVQKVSGLLTSFSKGFDTVTQGSQAMGKRAKADGEVMSSAFQNAGTSFGKLVASYVSAQAILGAAKGLWNGVVDEIESSIKAAGDAEKAHVTLVAALRAQGTAVPSVISAYQGYATALQRVTVFQDDAIESAAALMVQIGNVMPRDMEKALKATTNLASGLGIDLDTAVRLVAKSAEGNVTSLKKVGVIVDETKLKQEGFGAVLDKINEKFGGQAAAAASTYEGRLQQLSNTWNNVEESIGRAITTNETVLSLLGEINGVIDKNTGELRENAKASALVSDVVITTVRGVALFAQTLDLVQTGGTGFMQMMRWLGQGLGNIGVAAYETARALGHLLMIPGIDAQIDARVNALKAAVTELGNRNAASTASSAAFGAKLQEIAAAATALAARLEITRGKIVDTNDATDTGTDAWNRHTQAVQKADEAAKKYAAAQQALTDASTSFGTVLASVNYMSQLAVQHYLEMGVSQSDIATALHMTEAQVKAVATETGVYNKILDLNNSITVASTSVLAALGKVENDEIDRLTEIVAWRQRLAEIQKVKTGEIDISALQADVEEVGRIKTAIEKADLARQQLATGINGLAQAFAQLAQISGGSFGGAVKGIGQVIGAINLAQQAMKSLNDTIATGGKVSWGQYLTAATGTISAFLVLYQMFNQYVAQQNSQIQSHFALAEQLAARLKMSTLGVNGVGIDDKAGNAIIAEYLRIVAALRDNKLSTAGFENLTRQANALLETLTRLDVIAGAASSRFGPSTDDRQRTAQDAHDVLDFMLEEQKQGKVTQEQVNAAYVAYQQALADAGSAAAKAWIAAHGAIDATTQAMQDASASGYQTIEQLGKAAERAENLAEYMAQSGKFSAKDVADAFDKANKAIVAAGFGSNDEMRKAMADAAAAAAAATDTQATDTTSTVNDMGVDVSKIAIDTADTTTKAFDDAMGKVRGDFATLGPAASAAAAAIKSQFADLSFHIPVVFDVGAFPGGPIPTVPKRLALGGYGRIARPQLLLAGEAGAEDFVAGGAGRNLARDIATELSGLRGSGSDTPIVVESHATLYLDGRRVAESVNQHWDKNTAGVRTTAREVLGIP